MTRTSWNGTRSSASSVGMAAAPSGVRAEHTCGGSDGLPGSRGGAVNGLVEECTGRVMKEEGAVTRSHRPVAPGTLTGGAAEASVIPSSPMTAPESPRPPRAHGPPRGWCASRPPTRETQWDRFRAGSARRRWSGSGGRRPSSRSAGGSMSRVRETA